MREPTPHGGPDALGVPLFDFSTNSNACGPCPAVLKALTAVDASRYPDPRYIALRQQLADFHRVAARRVLLAGSASEFIFRITALIAWQPARAVSVPSLAYGDYAQAARAHGLAVVPSGEPAALHWACEPSSPLGQAHGLKGWVGAPGLRVLDCAYAPLRLSGSPSHPPEGLHTVWQLYSPNKALGLTGVRAAYAIAPPEADDDVRALDQLCPSWPVGAHGVALLQAWTRDAAQDWLAESRNTLCGWKAQQIRLCESLGWSCLPSDANFFCAQPALPSGVTLERALNNLRAEGIKLRDTASFDLPGHVRLGVLPPPAQVALKTAWQRLLKATR
ncbi:MAG: aminotransferase class I/II-fold pyridoxal phosphate-dependent enzyme [Polaromonas sp.]|nr:aminotransferase class I/II-fold pyridoxal phosphate-dependent enzyme [Polaromonas sp.]